MEYKKLKEFRLDSIKSQEEADNWKDEVIKSEKMDIIKYLNFLRWQQYNDTISFSYVNKIIKFLSYSEIIDFEKDHRNLITGDTEDLVMISEFEEEVVTENPVIIDDKVYSVKSVFSDDFESVMIVSDGEKLYKFGYIALSTLQGIELYAYELFEEPQDFYEEIIGADFGTKVNLYADIVGENQILKTFKKCDTFLDDMKFKLAKKTNKGIFIQNDSGLLQVLKKETVLSNQGVSEDRMQSQIEKFKSELSSKLGIKKQDVENASHVTEDMFNYECLDPEEKDCENCTNMSSCPLYKKVWSQFDFIDDFKFDKKEYFELSSIFNDRDPFNLTHTFLFYMNDKGRLIKEYNEKVYNFLEKMFDAVEDEPGIWKIENIKLERLVRKLISANAEVQIGDKNEFLKRFKKIKFNKILNPIMKQNIVKVIRTKTDIEKFVKDAGTELYYQINQTMTAILEGTQRLYGENHIVYDSDYKVIICKYDKLDLYEASCYAIDNNYKNFYVIEKDKFTSYDAWYKETLIHDEPVLEKVETVLEENTIFESDKMQDIVIMGYTKCHNHAKFPEEDVKLTDDFSIFDVQINGNKMGSYDSDGFITISDVKTYLKYYDKKDNEWSDCLLVKDFVGKINLKVTDKYGKLLDISKFKEEYLLRNKKADYVILDIVGENISCQQIDEKLHDEMEKNVDTKPKNKKSKSTKYILEVQDYKNSQIDWQMELFNEGINVGVMVFNSDGVTQNDQDVLDKLPEIEELNLGIVNSDDSGFLALTTELTSEEIKTRLVNAGFNVRITNDIISYLKNIYDNDKNMKIVIEDEEWWEPLWNTFYDKNVLTKEGENMDLENFEIISLTNDKLVAIGGGDWQTPVEFEIHLDNNEIKINKISDVDVNSDSEDSMSFNDFLNIIYDKKLPIKYSTFLDNCGEQLY